MKTKYVIAGIFTGTIIGIIVIFLFPNILLFGLEFNTTFNQRSGYLNDFYSITGGSIYNSFPIITLLFGLFGGMLGLIFFKFRSKQK